LQPAGWHFVTQHFWWQQNKVSRIATTALRTGVRGQWQVCPQAAFSQQATGLRPAFSQTAGAQACFAQQTLHFFWRHGFWWQQTLPQAAFSQQAGFA
jgi:hypothetical protein